MISISERSLNTAGRILALSLITITLTLVFMAPSTPWAQGPARLTRGVWYNSFEPLDYASPAVPQDLQQLKSRLCPDYIQLVAHVFQNAKTSTNPHIDASRSIPDEALQRVIDEVHRLGMKASLLITLFVDDGTWEGDIRPQNIDAWFESWAKVLLHYAELAQKHNAEVLLLGSELETIADYSEQWIKLIEQVRQRFSGLVSYSTNFWYERAGFEKVLNLKQWAQLDAIGITAYFELVNKTNPSLAELEAAWRSDRHRQNIISDLEKLNQRYGKPIQFWEIGYQSRSGTTIFPWDYRIVAPVDEIEQARAYQALLDVYQGVPWFKGYSIYTQAVRLPVNPTGYDVLGKAAEKVLSSACNK